MRNTQRKILLTFACAVAAGVLACSASNDGLDPSSDEAAIHKRADGGMHPHHMMMHGMARAHDAQPGDDNDNDRDDRVDSGAKADAGAPQPDAGAQDSGAQAKDAGADTGRVRVFGH
jgi:hypothetical protein